MRTTIDHTAALTRPCRHDGWTGDRRRFFLAAVSVGYSIEQARAHVGLSRASAYKCRHRDPAFARGWSAACLSARHVVALPDISIDGRVRTVIRKGGDGVRRHGVDNQPDLVRLAQIDRRIARDHVLQRSLVRAGRLRKAQPRIPFSSKPVRTGWGRRDDRLRSRRKTVRFASS